MNTPLWIRAHETGEWHGSEVLIPTRDDLVAQEIMERTHRVLADCSGLVVRHDICKIIGCVNERQFLGVEPGYMLAGQIFFNDHLEIAFFERGPICNWNEIFTFKGRSQFERVPVKIYEQVDMNEYFKVF